MLGLVYLTLLAVGVMETRRVTDRWHLTETQSHDLPALSPTGLTASTAVPHNTHVMAESVVTSPDSQRRRSARDSKDMRSKQRAEHHKHQHPRPVDPDSYFTTPRVFNGSLLVHNPLYPVTGESYGAYAVMLLALMVFAVGVVSNLAITCAVWHNHYLQNARNCVLASLALWDLAVIFFCLPVVIFHELTKRRLMGHVSCRLVPFIEVTSLGVNTFSLCALSVDRFQTLTSSSSSSKTPESFGSIVSKLSVIWVGSLLLAAPELMIWRLETELSHVSHLPVDSCLRLPPSSPHFSESLYSLIMTYHESRMWWIFGCFFCLPLLFSFSCHLLTSQISDSNIHMLSSCPASSSSSPSNKLVTMLTMFYGVFCLPEHTWNIGLTYAGVQVDGAMLALLALIGQFLMFVRASATPILILSLCRSLGQSFVDCCCCCCEECLPSKPSPSLASSSVPSSSSSPVLEKTKTSQVDFEKKMKEKSEEMTIGTPC